MVNDVGTPEPEDGEPTFADVLNDFSFGARHKRREPRKTSREDRRAAGRHDLETTSPGRPPRRAHEDRTVETPLEELAGDGDDAPAIVRAYAWTGGRTKSEYPLEIETLVATSEQAHNSDALARSEYRSVAALCVQPRSVAEVAALLSMPLGVAKVLLGDMAAAGVLTVGQTGSADGEAPDTAFLERVLSGLRRL